MVIFSHFHFGSDAHGPTLLVWMMIVLAGVLVVFGAFKARS